MTPIGGIGGAGGISSFKPPTLGPAAGAQGAAGPSFQGGLDAVAKSMSAASGAESSVATGTATNLHQVTIAATKAQLSLSMTVALRNRAVESYQEIMRMQV